MSQAILRFGQQCMEHIKQQLLDEKSAPSQGMSFSVVPIYGKAGKVGRMGVTVLTEPSRGHGDIVGYRLIIGFPTIEARAAANRGIEEVHQVIKGLLGLRNDSAWVLRDRLSNDVWFTFAVNNKHPEQFISDVITKSDMTEAFRNATMARQ